MARASPLRSRFHDRVQLKDYRVASESLQRLVIVLSCCVVVAVCVAAVVAKVVSICVVVVVTVVDKPQPAMRMITTVTNASETSFSKFIFTLFPIKTN